MKLIGVDLHSNSLTACYLSENGSENSARLSLKELVKFQETLELKLLSSGGSNGQHAAFPRSNQEFGEQSRGSESESVRGTPKSVKKTDCHDARKAVGGTGGPGREPEVR